MAQRPQALEHDLFTDEIGGDQPTGGLVTDANDSASGFEGATHVRTASRAALTLRSRGPTDMGRMAAQSG